MLGQPWALCYSCEDHSPVSRAGCGFVSVSLPIYAYRALVVQRLADDEESIYLLGTMSRASGVGHVPETSYFSNMYSHFAQGEITFACLQGLVLLYIRDTGPSE
jgi:hypothetical protein